MTVTPPSRTCARPQTRAKRASGPRSARARRLRPSHPQSTLDPRPTTDILSGEVALLPTPLAPTLCGEASTRSAVAVATSSAVLRAVGQVACQWRNGGETSMPPSVSTTFGAGTQWSRTRVSGTRERSCSQALARCARAVARARTLGDLLLELRYFARVRHPHLTLERLEARLVDLCTTRYLSELPPHGLCEAQRLASLALHHGCCCSAHLLHHGMQRLNLRAQALDRGFGGGQLRAQRAHLGGRVFSVALDALTALAQ